MNVKKMRYLPLILALAVLLGSFLIGNATAKYIYRNYWQATVTFTANLADDVILREHRYLRGTDGRYAKDGDDYLPATDENNVKDSGNEYYLIPGDDIPKDPEIVIINKSPVKSYLFLEVRDTMEVLTETVDEDTVITYTPLSYTLTPNWKPLTVKSDGTKVYVYANGDTPVKLDETLTKDKEGLKATISVLKDNKVTVSQYLNIGQYLNKGTGIDPDELRFRAVLNEIGTIMDNGTERERNPLEVYTNATATP